MSGTTTTPTVSGGSGGTTTSGSGSGNTPAAPAYQWVVTQPGNGFPVGTWITDAATIAELNANPPSWAVRVNVPAGS
ncbi:hypothetical protein NFI95_15590 [Acetobacteraceae bacterium KSS8]|uniref:LysM domain-containing protein n=1 Tax=Endosaccharibacter trunci TaxID=2812733 RepID=A0ABT1WAG1_9PROT|nr:hypothetical protein [Acetobacteraceae bacterium KSS8]